MSNKIIFFPSKIIKKELSKEQAPLAEIYFLEIELHSDLTREQFLAKLSQKTKAIRASLEFKDTDTEFDKLKKFMQYMKENYQEIFRAENNLYQFWDIASDSKSFSYTPCVFASLTLNILLAELFPKIGIQFFINEDHMWLEASVAGDTYNLDVFHEHPLHRMGYTGKKNYYDRKNDIILYIRYYQTILMIKEQIKIISQNPANVIRDIAKLDELLNSLFYEVLAGLSMEAIIVVNALALDYVIGVINDIPLSP